MDDIIREYVRECLSEGVKITGGGHTFRAKPGSQVSFTDATSGKSVSGTFKKKVSRGGHQYAHVETGKAAHYVPVHQMHGAKKIDEESLKEDDAHFAKQTPQMQTAINLHLRKGKSYSDAVAAAKKHVKE